MSVDLDLRPVLDRVTADFQYVADRLSHLESPGQILEAIREIYQISDPFSSALLASLIIGIVCYLTSCITKNQSVVDKLWSILPMLYTWHYVSHAHLRGAYGNSVINPRLLVIAVLVSVWSARLTFNFWRKGGYSWATEDYRWEAIRQGRSFVPVSLLPIADLLFIALYQNVLLMLLTLPVYACWRHLGTPLQSMDAVAGLSAAGFIIVEAIADQQQWNFQSEKRIKMKTNRRLTRDFNRGFLTTGLFKYSRHPNFFAEQAFWASLYLFAVSASGAWIHWSALAFPQLILLFQGSTALTEAITLSKHPKYKTYQACTSRQIPWFPRKPKWR